MAKSTAPLSTPDGSVYPITSNPISGAVVEPTQYGSAPTSATTGASAARASAERKQVNSGLSDRRLGGVENTFALGGQ